MRKVKLRGRHRSRRWGWSVCRAGCRCKVGMRQGFCSGNSLARVKLKQTLEQVDRYRDQVNRTPFSSKQKAYPEATP